MSGDESPGGIENSLADVLEGVMVLVWVLAAGAMLLHLVLFALGEVGMEGWTWWLALVLLLLMNALPVAIRVVE